MEKQDFGNIPDMIIVDGGKGQLTSAKEVLREFKTVENISNATIEELSKVKGITERIAQEILNTLHN